MIERGSIQRIEGALPPGRQLAELALDAEAHGQLTGMSESITLPHSLLLRER